VIELIARCFEFGDALHFSYLNRDCFVATRKKYFLKNCCYSHTLYLNEKFINYIIKNKSISHLLTNPTSIHIENDAGYPYPLLTEQTYEDQALINNQLLQTDWYQRIFSNVNTLLISKKAIYGALLQHIPIYMLFVKHDHQSPYPLNICFENEIYDLTNNLYWHRFLQNYKTMKDRYSNNMREIGTLNIQTCNHNIQTCNHNCTF